MSRNFSLSVDPSGSPSLDLLMGQMKPFCMFAHCSFSVCFNNAIAIYIVLVYT